MTQSANKKSLEFLDSQVLNHGSEEEGILIDHTFLINFNFGIRKEKMDRVCDMLIIIHSLTASSSFKSLI
jgi:hypothetical protein